MWLEEEETRQLLQEVPQAYQTQINDVLLAALGRVCGEWSGRDAVLVDVEGHGREEEVVEGVDLSRTVGWFTSMYPVVLEVGEASEWEPGRALSGTKELLRGVPGRGMGYGVLRYGKGNEEIGQRLRGLPQAEISFNYLGQIDQVMRESKLFRPGRELIGSESAAGNRRQHVLGVSGIVAQGRLQMDWNYSETLHRRETIAGLAERYLECLRQFIAHCLSPDAGGFTPSDFPLAGLTQKELDRWISKEDGIEDVYPLSAAQQGMLFHSLFERSSQSYFVQLSCQLASLDAPSFQRAWNEVIQRHSILRTGFLWDSLEEPVQVVHKAVTPPWQLLDARSMGAAEQESKWQAFLLEDRERGFNLQKAPLLRLTLMRTGENSYCFAWSSHHILLDAWCRETIIKEVFTLYEAYQQGNAVQLKRSPLYRDYIAWLQEQNEKAAEDFWRNELKGVTVATLLGIERKSESASERHETVEFTLAAAKELSDRLQELVRNHQITLNTFVQGAWGLLLSQYSGERDVVFGTPMSGRSAPIPGIEDIVGPFINTLPVRVHIEPEETIDQYLQRLQRQQASVRDFEHSSLMKVQTWSNIPHGKPLFENIVVFENYPADTALQQKVGGEMNITASAGFMSNHYSLTLTVVPGAQLTFMATYDRAAFEVGSIERLIDQLRAVLEDMSSHMQKKVAEVSMLTPAEWHRAVVEWNQTDATVSPAMFIDRFEEQVAKTPHAIAVSCQDAKLTYKDLSHRSNQVARFLQQRGIGADMRIGLCLERCPEMIVALLGILKSGAAYVPLDPAYPLERLEFMMQDAEMPLLLTSAPLRNILPTTWAQVVSMDEDWAEISSCSSGAIENCVCQENLAYLIYTSGSTGQPKGVAVTHGGLANYLQWAAESYGFDSGALSFLHSSLSFDLTVTSIYPSLITGGRIIVLPQSAGAGDIAKELNAANNSILKLTPGHLRLLNGLLDKSADAAIKARALVIGGEQLKHSDLTFWRSNAPETRLINEYGPTETVVGCCVHEVATTEESRGAVPIGKPIKNTKMYVLDEMLRPSPPGVKGEIYIGGKGVARGYWRRPDLTAERFVPDPFSKSGGERLYRAGDLARYRDDGTIEYMGRTDHQIKLRGYRIEAGEIESVLISHPAIKHAAVIVREDEPGDQRLVAYVVAEAGNVPLAEDVKEHLRTRLPEYMVPSAIVTIEQIPLTVNGKLDISALPKPETLAVSITSSTDEVAMQLEVIWQEILKVSPIGYRQSFFELGGHSLLAIRLVKRIEEQFGRELPLAAVFEASTIEQMSELLRREYRPTQSSHLVPMQTQGSKRPIFFIHPGGGGVGAYREIAKLLGEDQPFYALQALDEEENKLETVLSVEDRSARYIEAIQTIDPVGPYILGGWSMGGFIAYEMARQLKRQGKEISNLFLLDIVARNESSLASSGDEADELLAVTREMSTTVFSLEAVKDKSVEERLKYLLEQLIAEKVLAQEVTVPLVRGFLKGLRRRNQSMIEYKLLPYDGAVVLIRAEQGKALDHKEIDPADVTSGFSALCPKVDVAFVSGNHYDLMVSPNAEKLVQVMQGILGEFPKRESENKVTAVYAGV